MYVYVYLRSEGGGSRNAVLYTYIINLLFRGDASVISYNNPRLVQMHTQSEIFFYGGCGYDTRSYVYPKYVFVSAKLEVHLNSRLYT